MTGDLDADFGALRIDVTCLPFADASFEALICNRVLEHVPDDRRAMRELRRVLSPGGWAILLVPDVAADATHEDPSVVTPAERRRGFGQEDHVRRCRVGLPGPAAVGGLQARGRGDGQPAPGRGARASQAAAAESELGCWRPDGPA